MAVLSRTPPVVRLFGESDRPVLTKGMTLYHECLVLDVKAESGRGVSDIEVSATCRGCGARSHVANVMSEKFTRVVADRYVADNAYCHECHQVRVNLPILTQQRQAVYDERGLIADRAFKAFPDEYQKDLVFKHPEDYLVGPCLVPFPMEGTPEFWMPSSDWIDQDSGGQEAVVEIFALATKLGVGVDGIGKYIVLDPVVLPHREKIEELNAKIEALKVQQAKMEAYAGSNPPQRDWPSDQTPTP